MPFVNVLVWAVNPTPRNGHGMLAIPDPARQLARECAMQRVCTRSSDQSSGLQLSAGLQGALVKRVPEVLEPVST